MYKNFKKMFFVKYGHAIILSTVGIVVIVLFALKINGQPLLFLIFQSLIK
jgi:hypothetical protein